MTVGAGLELYGGGNDDRHVKLPYPPQGRRKYKGVARRLFAGRVHAQQLDSRKL